MKKLLFFLAAAFSGCAHNPAIEAVPKQQEKTVELRVVHYAWNGYSVNKAGISYAFKEVYGYGGPRQTCELKLGNVRLVDEACDGVVDRISDSTADLWRINGPEARFKTADEKLDKYRTYLKTDEVHANWEKNRWTFDPLSRYLVK